MLLREITASELRLARGAILERVRHKSEAFVITKQGHPIATLLPVSAFTPAAFISGLRKGEDGYTLDVVLLDQAKA